MSVSPPQPVAHEPAPPANLVLRTLVGLALAGLALGAIVAGAMALWLVNVTVAAIMTMEWATLVKASPTAKRWMQIVVAVPLALMCPLAAGPGLGSLCAIVIAASLVMAVTQRPVLGAGLIYVGLPVLALLFIRMQGPDGVLWTLWTMALVWMADIGGFFVGRAIGGPRLAPAISPHKTWAGLVGGVALAAMFGLVLHYVWGLPWLLVGATPVLAALSQAGDLFESWLKRNAGVKDSGGLLPGHGGLMDRLDGLVPVAPAAALLLLLAGLAR